MVRCQVCQKSVQRAQRVVTETRSKTYEPRFRDKTCVDKGGTGTEIVSEIVACSGCVAQ